MAIRVNRTKVDFINGILIIYDDPQEWKKWKYGLHVKQYKWLLQNYSEGQSNVEVILPNVWDILKTKK